jgi:type I restriction enzyme S subunit
MTETPTSWQLKRIDQICNLGRGRVISQEEIRRHSGVYPVFSSQSKDDGVFGYLDTYDFEGDYVTWTTDGANAGTVFFRTGRFNCTNVCGTLKPKSSDISASFLARALSLVTKRHVSYVGNPKLMNNVMAAIELWLPSKPEQDFIALVLDTVDEAIAKTEAVIAKLRQVRAGLLHDLLTRGLDAHGQLRDPIAHPEQFQDSPLGQLPREWRVAPLREIAEVGSGVTLGRNLDKSGTLELPYLRVANVQDGYLDLADVKTVRIYPDELPRFQLQLGDVLMNEGGDYDKLGRGTVWEGQLPICLHQNHVFRVRCSPDILDCYFLAAVSGSVIGKRYFLQSSKQSTNLASINSTQLNAFAVPVPSLREQRAVVHLLDTHDTLIESEATSLAKLVALKSGLMTDLLTGRVRVPEMLDSPARNA